MKYLNLLIFGICFSLLNPGKLQANEKEWFKFFTSSFSKISSDHIEKQEQKEKRYEKYNFKPQSIKCWENDKVSLSVEGLEYITLTFQHNNNVRSGDLSDPYFIDKKGERHPVIFSNKDLLIGNIRQKDFFGKRNVRFNRAIQKVRVSKDYVKFESEIANNRAFLEIEIDSDYGLEKQLEIDIKKLKNEVLNKYPDNNNSIAFEINAGIENIIVKSEGLLPLYKFYIENCHTKYRNEFATLENISNDDLFKVRQAFVLSQRLLKAQKRANEQNTEALKMALKDCQTSFPDQFTKANNYLKLATQFEVEKQDLILGLEAADEKALAKVENYFRSFDEALLANPILDFDDIMLLKRDVDHSHTRMAKQLGFPSLNSHNNTKIPEIEGNWHNSIVKLSDLRGEKKLETVFTPQKEKLITDLELDFDRENIMFSMENENDQWHVFETNIEGKNLIHVTPDTVPDVNHFDACYLPNGDVVFTSDATYQGLPCEGGSRPMALLYVKDAKTGKIRQLTYEQDSDFCPTVLNNGRLMYLRWEYSDLAHYFSRILMSCNPDGTGQMEYYGSNSYFPNSYFYARPIPGHSTQVVGVVGGHHGITRSGRLMIIDPSKGRSEAEGVVHEIPRRGQKVEPIIKDELVRGVWPQFLHPYPLNDKYFLVSAKLDETSLWGIYLVDVFDNMTLIKEIEGSALFDPIPLRKEPTPPVIPSRINQDSKEATVFLNDIYQGEGLAGIPRGTVKNLRLFAYHYGHIATGGHNTVGVESSWDIKRILGTVPVHEDGSAMFKIPANTPISIQPLDSTGQALQIMRSWFVGMPGENVSCIGCHERTNQAPPNMFSMASRKAPEKIKHWQGNPRPFSFRYEVQPVLDKYCISCHDGARESIPDLRKSELVDMEGLAKAEYFLKDKAYMALHPLVRRPGPESDLHLLKPMEYHAGTSELVQMLQRGHHGVDLKQEDWEKIYTWIDLNAPYRGKWSPPEFRDFDQDERRKCLSKEYANITTDPEAEYDSLVTYMEGLKVEPIEPIKKKRSKYEYPLLAGWPFSGELALKKQKQNQLSSDEITIGNEKIKFVSIPKGKFVKGNRKGYSDERKPEIVEIDKSFHMSECEITNAQFAEFDSTHNSRFIDQQWKDHTTPGYAANKPNQPVIRVTYEQAVAFCEWLSKKTGKNVTLPSQNQWEWACRAGSDSDFWFSNSSSDFGEFENLSDNEVRKFAVQGVNPSFIGDNHKMLPYYAFTPREKEVNDGHMVVAPVGSYKPNPWGLFDMHGNVAEWTSSSYKNTGELQDKYYTSEMKVVKGGSWRDRTKISKSGSKRYYLPYQKIYNVGFRVIIEEEKKVAELK